MRIARARPSRWHLLEVLKPHGAGEADGVPRDHPRGHRARHRQLARHRRRPGRRPGGPPHPRPPLRLPGGRGAAGARSRRACRPAGCRARRSAWSSSASASAWRSSPPATGTSTPRSRPTPAFTADARRASTAAGRRAARTSTTPASSSAATTSPCSTRPAARGLARRPRRRRRSRCAASRRSRTRRAPKPPFITSTLQQEGGRKLRMTRRQVMRVGPGPLRGRLHHLHADRLAPRCRRPRSPRPAARSASCYGARVRARRAPHLRQQGQERPGGPRGHPPGRRLVPHARRQLARRAARRRPRASTS